MERQIFRMELLIYNLFFAVLNDWAVVEKARSY